MKICWDNLERVRYNSQTGTFRVGRGTYSVIELCLNCGESFLGQKPTTLYCSEPCRYSSKEYKQIMSREGKLHSNEIKERMSANRSGNMNYMFGRTGNKCYLYKGGYYSNNLASYDTYAHQL